MKESANRQRSVAGTCIALVCAAIGDAGPEIIDSGSVIAGYDGPGPLIYLAFAAAVATLRWRYTPLLAVITAAIFLVGGFFDPEFATRLLDPAQTIGFMAAWLQTISFAATIGFGIAAFLRSSPPPPRSQPIEISTARRPAMSTTMNRSTTPRSTNVALLGMAIGIVGLAIQWVAEPSKFPGFPPGMIVIAVCAAIVAIGARMWWTPVFAILVGLLIVGGGLLSGQLTENLASDHVGTIAGNVVMGLGLILGACAGAVAMLEARRCSVE